MSVIQFQIPFDGELLIKKEDRVGFQTPLFKQLTKVHVSVPLAKILHTSPSKIFQSLKKFVGDKIAKGDIVAESSSFLSKKKYMSEYDGTLKEVNHQNGTIVLEVNTEDEGTVNAFFIGEIDDIEAVQHASGGKTVNIKLKTKHSKEYEVKEASESFGGEVVYCKNPIKSHLTADEVSHKVVVDERIPSYEQVKYEALGAKGFISLHTLPEKSVAHFAKLTGEPDHQKIEEHRLPYCLVLKTESKVFFYE